MVEYKVEVLSEGYEWLVSFKSKYNDLVYVVSICIEDIDFEKNEVEYVHIENIDYIYHVSGGIGKCYDIFKSIEKLIIEEIKTFL